MVTRSGAGTSPSTAGNLACSPTRRITARRTKARNTPRRSEKIWRKPAVETTGCNGETRPPTAWVPGGLDGTTEGQGWFLTDDTDHSEWAPRHGGSWRHTAHGNCPAGRAPNRRAR